MKYRLILPLLTFLMITVLPSRTWAEAETPSADAPKVIAASAPQNVILLSWDGLDRRTIKELLGKERVPNLATLIKEGSYQDIDVKGHITVTKPGHAEMLTGLPVDVTGVYTNGKYRPIPEGYTIFERLQTEFGGLDKIHCFMVTGKVAHVGGRSADEVVADGKKGKKIGKGTKKKMVDGVAPPGADDAPEDAKDGEPFFLTKKHLDVFDAQQRDAEQTGPLCLKYLNQYKEPRFMAFLHFSDPDHNGHRHGSNSEEYRVAAVKCDTWLGKIIEWLKQENLYEKTLIYVMTDHGFDYDAYHHKNAPDSWLVTNDKSVSHGGIIADVPVTILARFGVNLEKLEPKLIGKPLFDKAVDAPSSNQENTSKNKKDKRDNKKDKKKNKKDKSESDRPESLDNAPLF